MSKNVIIVGSSGMMGQMLLSLCLENKEIASVTSLVRKPGTVSHPKLKEIVHSDFLDYSAIEDTFENQDICFFCIGVYTGQVPPDQFHTITVEYTKAFAETLKKKSTKTSFVFLSGQGADSSEKSRVLFAREKGIAENILIGLNFDRLCIVRPGYIYPSIPRKEPNFSYVLFRILYEYSIRFIYPNIGLTSKKLAAAMFFAGMKSSPKLILENNDLRKFDEEKNVFN
jgi:hypothetical protein